ncbi:MAG: hypothetical protein M0P69_04455 [Bacteroidales bacterium]|nr:hypothetical protein [Bacteroidales bacterium]
MKVRIIDNGDNSVGVIYPITPDGLDLATPKNAVYVNVESSELPADDEREGWFLDKGKISINKSSQKLKEYKRTKLINQEKTSIIETLAIDSLKNKGVLDQDGSLKFNEQGVERNG